MSPIKYDSVVKTLVATTVASILLAACAAAPLKPDGATEARAKLTQLQSDPNLASRAPVAMKEADSAVREAEQPQVDKDLGAYRVYMADRKIDTARALAETSLAEDQRAALSADRDKARLDARTHEADVAKGQVAAARGDANAAQAAAASSEQQTAELQRQIDMLQAKATDRGLVLTLGDVLFATGRADLKSGASGNLNKLVAFLNKYPDRTVLIEGYTDNVGSEDYNQALSERRADSVKSYLAEQGIGALRLSASGKGESDAVGSNDSSTGRQQNRRVEVIISNPSAALR
jgi:outer membrane protein OmpA-like peptidoglycan-associated protein